MHRVGKGGKNRRRGKNMNFDKRELTFKEEGQGRFCARNAAFCVLDLRRHVMIHAQALDCVTNASLTVGCRICSSAEDAWQRACRSVLL